MIAVADASPLCYLVLIGEIELLPQCFTRVLVPQAVIAELRHDDAPAAVREWASNLPAWMALRLGRVSHLLRIGLHFWLTFPPRPDHATGHCRVFP